MGRSLGFFSILALGGCTAIRPLVTADGSFDAGTDAGISIADAGADGGPDAGCSPGSPELCNGFDDDCDPSSEDGSGDTRIGDPCDGADADECVEGTFTACTAGALACDDATADTVEVCGGGDEDCDGETDEEGAVGSQTFYLDADLDSFGTDASARMTCTQPPPPPIGRWVGRTGDCDDTNEEIRPNRIEDCDGLDNDCSGEIDEGTCPCPVRRYGGHTYFFCDNSRPYDSAQGECETRGYHLAFIEDDAENTFIRDAAMLDIGNMSVWIGLETAGPGFVWTDGTLLGSYAPWDATEPDMSGTCVAMRMNDLLGTVGAWHDFTCSQAFGYVCETP